MKTLTFYEVIRTVLFKLPFVGSSIEQFLRDSYKKSIIDKDYAKPTAMNIELNNSCNFKCAMCPRDELKEPEKGEGYSNAGNLPFETFQKVADDCAKQGIMDVSLFIFGEPLMYPRLIDAIKYGKSKGLKLKFNSNAMLLTENKAREIIESGLDEVHFSMDGLTPDKYPKIRIGGKHEVVWKNVQRFCELKKELKSSTPKITLKAISNFNTKQEIKEFKNYWKGMVDKIFMGELTTYSKSPMYKFLKRKKYTPKYCTYPAKRLVVTANGYYAPCCSYYLDHKGDLNYGDAKAMSIMDVWNSPKVESLRNKIKSGHLEDTEACKKCVN
ncbi:MAG TPA: radical SAM protein [Candidatus Nanoarchaeia archaeon]|nr:radical SAM protein [Candidatus Nanoarchaeia archaeon]